MHTLLPCTPVMFTCSMAAEPGASHDDGALHLLGLVQAMREELDALIHS